MKQARNLCLILAGILTLIVACCCPKIVKDREFPPPYPSFDKATPAQYTNGEQVFPTLFWDYSTNNMPSLIAFHIMYSTNPVYVTGEKDMLRLVDDGGIYIYNSGETNATFRRENIPMIYGNVYYLRMVSSNWNFDRTSTVVSPLSEVAIYDTVAEGKPPPKNTLVAITPMFSNTLDKALGWQTTNLWPTLTRTNPQGNEYYKFSITNWKQ